MKNDLDFQGASGRVKFSDNNRPNLLAVKQVLQGKEVEVGLVELDGKISWIGNGTSDAAWAEEPADPPERFGYWLVFQIGVPTLILTCACVFGIRVGLKRHRLDVKHHQLDADHSKDKAKSRGFDASTATNVAPSQSNENNVRMESV